MGPPPTMRPTDHYAGILRQLGTQDKKKHGFLVLSVDDR